MTDHNHFSNLTERIADLLRGPYRPLFCTPDKRGFNGRFRAWPPRVNEGSLLLQKKRSSGRCGG